MSRNYGALFIMTPEETTLFEDLGSRIAGLRKECGLTQTQLGEMIGVSQQQAGP